MEIVNLKELALKKVKIAGNVIGKFGTFEIEQEYKNNTKDVLEVSYTFPITETATVVGFEINVGDKVLKGKCKNREDAIKEYQTNIIKGNSAYMMEQQAQNIFKINIGKINVDEEVKIKIQYIDNFQIVDNKIEILIPTLVTPRYASNVTNRLTYGKVEYTVDFDISIDKMINIKNISSPTHKLNLIDEEKKQRVKVLDYDLSKEFKLIVEMKEEVLSNAITSKTRDGKQMLYLSFMPEIVDTYEDSEKEYIFIVDVSGSMEGKKIEETKRAVKECLKQLDIGDKFNIIQFNHQFKAMELNSIEYNEENAKKAINYVDNLKTSGGTEILKPIQFALYEKEAEKIVLLFTDGQVGNESQIIEYVKNNINKSRIFSFGIDNNVNAYFIKELAKEGHGKGELIHINESIDDKIIRTFARIQSPLVEEIKINYGKNKIIDEIKEENSLFNYELFNVFAKIEDLQDDIELKGKILGREYVWKIKKEDIKSTVVDLEILFAKQEIERIEKYMRSTYDFEKREIYKEMIIELSEKYNINSKYTSFITVYEREDKLFDMPKRQETQLSDQFFESEIGMCDYELASAGPIKRRTGTNLNQGGLDIPQFIRKKKEMTEEQKELNYIYLKMSDKIKKYYKKFMEKEEKNILTYLLYAILYAKTEEFDYGKFLEFINKNKDVISSMDTYMNLIYLCYHSLNPLRVDDRNKTLEFLGEKYRKILFTKMTVEIELETLTDKEAKQIIEENKVEEKIDAVIWYFSQHGQAKIEI